MKIDMPPASNDNHVVILWNHKSGYVVRVTVMAPVQVGDTIVADGVVFPVTKVVPAQLVEVE